MEKFLKSHLQIKYALIGLISLLGIYVIYLYKPITLLKGILKKTVVTQIKENGPISVSTPKMNINPNPLSYTAAGILIAKAATVMKNLKK